MCRFRPCLLIAVLLSVFTGIQSGGDYTEYDYTGDYDTPTPPPLPDQFMSEGKMKPYCIVLLDQYLPYRVKSQYLNQSDRSRSNRVYFALKQNRSYFNFLQMIQSCIALLKDELRENSEMQYTESRQTDQLNNAILYRSLVNFYDRKFEINDFESSGRRDFESSNDHMRDYNSNKCTYYCQRDCHQNCQQKYYLEPPNFCKQKCKYKYKAFFPNCQSDCLNPYIKTCENDCPEFCKHECQPVDQCNCHSDCQERGQDGEYPPIGYKDTTKSTKQHKGSPQQPSVSRNDDTISPDLDPNNSVLEAPMPNGQQDNQEPDKEIERDLPQQSNSNNFDKYHQKNKNPTMQHNHQTDQGISTGDSPLANKTDTETVEIDTEESFNQTVQFTTEQSFSSFEVSEDEDAPKKPYEFTTAGTNELENDRADGAYLNRRAKGVYPNHRANRSGPYDQAPRQGYGSTG